MKKSVLIVSYYFPPLTGAPAWRSFSWSRFFNEMGWHPVILTRHWNGNETGWEEHVADIEKPERFETHETYDIYFLPSKKTKLYKLFTWLNITFLRRVYFTILQLFGHFNTEVNAYLSFKDKLDVLLKTGKFSTVIFTGPPPNIFRLINVAQKYPAVKVILDYRDLSNNAMISRSQNFSLKERITNSLFDKYELHWMNKADLVTAVAPAFRNYLQPLTKTKVEVVFNGYDNDFFEKIPTQQSDKFTVSLIGAIYPKQNYHIMLDGLVKFLQDNNSEDISVNAIGILMSPEVAKNFEAKLPDKRVYLSERVSKEEAIKYARNSHCLLFTAWDERPGMMPAKFYDYLASGNFIINCPGENDIIDRIIKDSGAGVTLNSVAEFTETLSGLYQQWKSNGKISFERNEKVIEYYSRRNQAKLMVELMEKLNS